MSRLALRVVVLVAVVMTAQAWVLAQKSQSAKANSDTTSIINLNTASPEQLDSLPGIGPKIAARIIEYRQKNVRSRRSKR